MPLYRKLGLLVAGLVCVFAAPTAQAQLYMSGAGGLYSNLESQGLAGRFALGAEPLDWIKIEGSVLATGHADACCTVAADATGWLTVLGVGPLEVGAGAGYGLLSYIDKDDPSKEYDWKPYFVGGVESEFALTRHFAFFGRAELGLGEIRGYGGLRLGF